MLTVKERGGHIADGTMVVVLKWEELVPIIRERFPNWTTLNDRWFCGIGKDVFDELNARGPIPARVDELGFIGFDGYIYVFPENSMVYAEEYHPEPTFVAPDDASGLFAWLEA